MEITGSRIWRRYRAARLFYVGARAVKCTRLLSFLFAVFEFIRINPSIKIKIKKEVSMYLIWSFEHNAWWAPYSMGYRDSVEEAGLYTKDQAERICRDANRHCDKPNEEMRLASDYGR